MSDVFSIVWKEWRELFGQRGLRGKTGILLNVAAFGVVIPWQLGAGWLESPLSALAWAWVPLWLVVMLVSDAFAGERERHTLETLLATRLTDSAILGGKVAAAISYGLGTSILAVLAGAVTMRVAHGAVPRLPLQIALPVGVAALLLALTVAALGVLISLRSATVRQAEQTMGGVVVLGLLGPALLVKELPAAMRAWASAPGHATLLGYGVMALLGALAFTVTAPAAHQFRRGRLLG